MTKKLSERPRLPAKANRDRITFQKRTVNDADNITPVVVPVFIHKLRRHTLHLIGKSVFTGNVKALLQRRRYDLTMLLSVFPNKKAAENNLLLKEHYHPFSL